MSRQMTIFHVAVELKTYETIIKLEHDKKMVKVQSKDGSYSQVEEFQEKIQEAGCW